MTEVYIYDSLRTPFGRRGGALYEVKPIDLMSALLRALQERHKLDTAAVDDVLVGCITPVGDQGANLPRAALLHAGWSERVAALQLNRFCASGLEAINLAAMKIRSGWGALAVAGGIESTSRVPAGSDGGAMVFDPEIIHTTNFIPQGVAADLVATIAGFDRTAVDRYAWLSRQRAATALQQGYYERTLVPILDHNGQDILRADETEGLELTEEQLAGLSPAFGDEATRGFDEMALRRYPRLERIEHVHTAGNSAAAVDGAGILLLGDQSKGETLGLSPRGRILAAATVGVDSTHMLTGPAPAAQQALSLAGLAPEVIDLWACNESFAAPVLQFQREMAVPEEKLNVNGGAIALGNPMGAAGAVLLGGLLDELERRGLQRGLVVMSVGSGMGAATVVERVK